LRKCHGRLFKSGWADVGFLLSDTVSKSTLKGNLNLEGQPARNGRPYRSVRRQYFSRAIRHCVHPGSFDDGMFMPPSFVHTLCAVS